MIADGCGFTLHSTPSIGSSTSGFDSPSPGGSSAHSQEALQVDHSEH